MPVAYLRPGEFVEIVSYDLFITGLGLSIAGAIVRASSAGSPTSTALLISSGILTVIALLLWRLSTSVEKRVEDAVNAD